MHLAYWWGQHAPPRLRMTRRMRASGSWSSSNVVLSLTGFVGYHIHFQFAPDERFVSLGAGDSAILDVGVEANHLL